jgi:hypothetical protein
VPVTCVIRKVNGFTQTSSLNSKVSSPPPGGPCHPLRQLARIATAPRLSGRSGPPAWQDQLPILGPSDARRPEYQSLKLEREQHRQVSRRCIGHRPLSPRNPVVCTLLSKKKRLRQLATGSPVHTGTGRCYVDRLSTWTGTCTTYGSHMSAPPCRVF